MSRVKASRPKAKTFSGCAFTKVGGYPCDLEYPRYAMARGGRKDFDRLVKEHLCEKCQPHAVRP